MIRRQVLVVCMFDSIHAGRWLSQFTDQDIDFTLFPSKKFKKIHPKLALLIKSNKGAKYSIAHPLRINKILGYLDFLFFLQLSKIFKSNFRAYYLKRIIARKKYDFVHALEIQGAGYLCDEAITKKDFQFILTNWGSDIFYFQHLPEHLPRIQSVLAKADLYSAECQRDYRLATNLGFKGRQLPCIPNGGGLLNLNNSQIEIPISERKNIVVKAYGGIFGRGDIAIEAISNLFAKNSDLTAFFYSITDDLISSVMQLVSKYGNRICFSTIKDPISHEELLSVFGKSKIYIGCSVSDGISTSFLEALTKGVYPIQTNTSCAGEWLEKGIIASLINLDLSELELELWRVITEKDLIDFAARANLQVAIQNLSFEGIKKKALVFYS